MPNKRAAGIVNVSFTMPASMAEMLESRARRDMTNKSEIVRRAIMGYLSPSETASIMSSVLNDAGDANLPTGKPGVNYPKGRGKKA